MNNYIFMNAPQNKGEVDKLIKKLEIAIASSVVRQQKNVSYKRNTYVSNPKTSATYDLRIS